MAAFSAHLVVLDNQLHGKGVHASLQSGQSFVYAPPVTPPSPPASVPTQQIVIVSASICSVSYGGSR